MRTPVTGVAAALALLVVAAAQPLAASAQPREPVDGSLQKYIVSTTSVSGASLVAGDVRRSGGAVHNVYSRSFSGLTATLTSDQARRLRSNSRVASVTPDAVFHSSVDQKNPTWGLDRIDQRARAGNKNYSYSTTGAGVTAFVVDTGTRLTHSQFGSRAKSGYDFVDYDNNASDCDGHGTHVAGTIGGSTYGAAKSVKLVAVRVLDCEGSGWASDIIDALDWVIAHKTGPSVVNMSIGGGVYAPLDAAVERTVKAGITVVVAAGNDGEDACASSPARAPHAITVAATDSRDVRPWWSNVGRCVDLFAPGVDVRSASNASNSATEIMSGTSMATPHVAGLVARYLQAHPRSTPAQVTSALVAATTKNAVKDAQGTANRLLYAAPAAAPAAPSSVVVSQNDTTNTASIRWGVPADNGGRAVTGYRVTRNGMDSKGVGPKTVIVAASSRAYTFTLLRDTTSYSLSVSAINSVGTGAAATRTVTLR